MKKEEQCNIRTTRECGEKFDSCISPSLKEIRRYVLYDTTEQYNMQKVKYIESFYRMEHQRNRFLIVRRLELQYNVLYLERFYFMLWKYKYQKEVNFRLREQKQLLGKMKDIYIKQERLRYCENLLRIKRLREIFTILKVKLYKIKRICRQSELFYKELAFQRRTKIFYLLENHAVYCETITKMVNNYQNGELNFEWAFSEIATRIEEFQSYFRQLLEYYQDNLADLNFAIEKYIIAESFSRLEKEYLKEEFITQQENNEMNNKLSVENIFYTLKEQARNRHYLLGKYMFEWRYMTFNSEDRILRIVSLKTEELYLRKWLIYKNTSTLKRHVEALQLSKIATTWLLLSSFLDYAFGFSRYVNGTSIRVAEILTARETYYSQEIVAYREKELKIKFIKNLSYSLYCRKSYFRLLFIGSVFSSFLRMKLSFKLLNIKNASVIEYKVLEMDSKQLFVEQLMKMIDSKLLHNIYMLAASENNKKRQLVILREYPQFVENYCKMILECKMPELESELLLYDGEKEVFDVLLVSNVLVNEEELQMGKQGAIINADEKYKSQVKELRSILCSYPQEASLLISLCRNRSSYEQFNFQRSVRMKNSKSVILPLLELENNLRLRQHEEDSSFYHTTFPNNEIMPYCQYLFQEFSFEHLVLNDQELENDLIQEYILKNDERNSTPKFSQQNTNILQDIFKQYNVSEENKENILDNYEEYLSISNAMITEQIMDDLRSIVQPLDQEIKAYYYECKILAATPSSAQQCEYHNLLQQEEEKQMTQETKLLKLKQAIEQKNEEEQRQEEQLQRAQRQSQMPRHALSTEGSDGQSNPRAGSERAKKKKYGAHGKRGGKNTGETNLETLVGEEHEFVEELEEECLRESDQTQAIAVESSTRRGPPGQEGNEGCKAQTGEKTPGRGRQNRQRHASLQEQPGKHNNAGDTKKEAREALTGETNPQRRSRQNGQSIGKTRQNTELSYNNSNQLSGKEQSTQQQEEQHATWARGASGDCGGTGALQPCREFGKFDCSAEEQEISTGELGGKSQELALRTEFSGAHMQNAVLNENFSVPNDENLGCTMKAKEECDNELEKSVSLSVLAPLDLLEQDRGYSHRRNYDTGNEMGEQPLFHSNSEAAIEQLGKEFEDNDSHEMTTIDELYYKSYNKIMGLRRQKEVENEGFLDEYKEDLLSVKKTKMHEFIDLINKAASDKEPELIEMLNELIDDPINALNNKSNKYQLLMQYIIFSDLSLREILENTESIEKSSFEVLNELFTDEFRKNMKEIVEEEILLNSLPSDELINSSIELGNDVDSSLVRSYICDLNQQINSLSGEIFEVSNIKIKGRLKRALEPLIVEELKEKLERQSKNSNEFVGKELVKISAKTPEKTINLLIKEEQQVIPGMMIKSYRLANEKLQEVDICTYDFGELNLEISSDGDFIDRYHE